MVLEMILLTVKFRWQNRS